MTLLSPEATIFLLGFVLGNIFATVGWIVIILCTGDMPEQD